MSTAYFCYAVVISASRATHSSTRRWTVSISSWRTTHSGYESVLWARIPEKRAMYTSYHYASWWNHGDVDNIGKPFDSSLIDLVAVVFFLLGMNHTFHFKFSPLGGLMMLCNYWDSSTRTRARGILRTVAKPDQCERYAKVPDASQMQGRQLSWA